MLGPLDEIKTADNMRRHPECVINIPDPPLWPEVEKLAPLTDKNPVPELKTRQFHFGPHKFETADLTPFASEVVKPMRVKECPVHMEARVERSLADASLPRSKFSAYTLPATLSWTATTSTRKNGRP
jgi:flavin reductase (DIM6/NTAB) family NADH-FMN oxidoreductase RutF